MKHLFMPTRLTVRTDEEGTERVSMSMRMGNAERKSYAHENH